MLARGLFLPALSTASQSRFPFTYTSILIKYRTRLIHSTIPIQDLSENEYHEKADEIMDALIDNLEQLGDETTLKNFDVQYNSGVLSLTLGVHGSYVINKQPPNKQIWLSSPVSGPKRFDFSDDGRWVCRKTGLTIKDIMNGEISAALNKKVAVV